MTDDSSTSPAVPVGTRPGRRRSVRRWLMVAVGVVALLVVVNAITPRPYVAVFRALIGTIDDSVELGPYADQVGDVVESGPVAVPVEGAPDAVLTIYTPDEAATQPRPLLLLVHGGGWTVGTAEQVGSYAALLASRGIVVANLDYSLAPEHTYPTPVRQAAAAIDHLHAHAEEYGADPDQLFVGGNSAGAQISAQLGALVTDPSFQDQADIPVDTPAASLRGVILYSGPYDFDTVEAAGFPGFRTYAWAYTGVKDYLAYPRIDELSTVRTATADYPPTYMTVGDADPLLPQTYELDAVLRALGVDVTSRYWTGSGAGLPHDYQFDLRTPEARTAFEDTVAFIDADAARS